MSKKQSSQVHNDNPGSGAEPASASGPGARSGDWDATSPFRMGMDLFTRVTGEQLARVQSLYDELADLEGETYERARRTGRELATMMEQTVTYMTSMTAQMQAISLEVARKSHELLSR